VNEHNGKHIKLQKFAYFVLVNREKSLDEILKKRSSIVYLNESISAHNYFCFFVKSILDTLITCLRVGWLIGKRILISARQSLSVATNRKESKSFYFPRVTQLFGHVIVDVGG